MPLATSWRCHIATIEFSCTGCSGEISKLIEHWPQRCCPLASGRTISCCKRWIAELHAASLGCCQPLLGALDDHLALMLGNSSQDVNGKPTGIRHITAYEIHLDLHQPGDQVNVACQSVELGNDQLGLVLFAGRNRLGQLRAIFSFAAFDLDELIEQLPFAAVEIVLHRLALRRHAVTANALLVG